MIWGFISLNGKFIGVVSGITFFLVLLYLMFFLNADFDQQLIEQVEMGNYSETSLFTEIEKETAYKKALAKKELDSHIMDMKYWDQTNTKPENDLEYVTQTYHAHIETILKCEEVRKKFVKKEISKEQFIEEITSLKHML